MLENKDKEKAKLNQKKFRNAPTLQNLKAIEDQFNRFAPALITAFAGVYKDWNPGSHLRIVTKKSEEFTAYGTLHTNKAQFLENYRGYERAFDINTLICQFKRNKMVMWFWGNPKIEHYIELWGDKFLLNGVEEEYKIYNHGKFTSVDMFRNASLLSQCSAKHAHLGGKAKAAKQSGYQKVRMLFQHKNGECPTEDIKSVVDAYRICAPFIKSRKTGESIKIKQFRRNIPTVDNLYNGYSLDCGSYIIYLSFEGLMTRCLNKYIYKENKETDLNKEFVSIKEEGHKTLKNKLKKCGQTEKNINIMLIYKNIRSIKNEYD